MHDCKIRNLDAGMLADREFLLHPEKADWQEIVPDGGEINAASKRGLRIVCSNCGGVVESVQKPVSGNRCFFCSDCGEGRFYVYVFLKKKRTRASREAKRKEPATAGAAAIRASRDEDTHAETYSPAPEGASAFSKSGSSSHHSLDVGEMVENVKVVAFWLGFILFLVFSVGRHAYPPLPLSIERFFGSETAAAKIVQSHLSGRGWFQTRSEHKAWAMCESYAHRGDSRCAKMLAQHYRSNGDLGRAAYWFEKACDWMDAARCYQAEAQNASEDWDKMRAYADAIRVAEKQFNELARYSSEKSSTAYLLGVLCEKRYRISRSTQELRNALEWYKIASRREDWQRLENELREKLPPNHQFRSVPRRRTDFSPLWQ